MARAPVLAAGGIVLRQEQTPLIAVVRLRKRNEWVLPKGKLDDGETPRDAAEREVLEETGHEVSVHEFLGTLVYESGGRFKVVHYWRMEAGGEPSHELMDDVRAVDWLPLEAAVERLSRAYERAFLANVGPLALEAARSSPQTVQGQKAAGPDKRRRPPVARPQPPLTMPARNRSRRTDVVPSPPMPELACDDCGRSRRSRSRSRAHRSRGRSSDCATALGDRAPPTAGGNLAMTNDGDPNPEARSCAQTARNLVQSVRDWLSARCLRSRSQLPISAFSSAVLPSAQPAARAGARPVLRSGRCRPGPRCPCNPGRTARAAPGCARLVAASLVAASLAGCRPGGCRRCG